MAAGPEQVAIDRIARLFGYLKALNEHRNPATRQLSDYSWLMWLSDLPDHPAVRQGKAGTTSRPDEAGALRNHG